MSMHTGILAGDPFRLGSHWDGNGVNFAVAALNADRVELCLFDERGERELARIPLPGNHAGVWHGYLPNAAPGLLYGYRAHGPFVPERGHRYNAAKLLLDPYARQVHGRYLGQADFCDHLPGDPARPDHRDNGRHALKAAVYDDRSDFDWDGDRLPHTPWSDTVIYELHAKGFSKRNPSVPEALQGTYAGLAHPASVDWLKRLGITTVELLPIAAWGDEDHLLRRNLTNYWGYNPLAFMAVEARYAAGANPITEFKGMVKTLHAAGIEVLLDVVFNHTAEGGVGGPTFNLRGLDNHAYYHLTPNGQYANWTGCGNTLNLGQPRCLHLVLDAMRYWARLCHVDGFRFDLAPILARGIDGAFSAWSTFLAAVMADPVLNQLKLIAEPWDLGLDGYRVGGFPAGWAEWNDRFRDSSRAFWLRHGATRGELARRWTASSELFERRGRQPWASVNFVTAHDGFTLHDLTSYSAKHNEANGEDNRDGHNENRSWNGGAEGPSDDRDITERRARLRRALLATLLFSQGTPMLLSGDEMGHTQGGNNNAYCQDNETSWLDWTHADTQLAAYTARLLALRRRLAALRHDEWFSAGSHGGYERPDVAWRNAAGHPMSPHDWDDAGTFSLSIELGPEGARERCLLLLNGEAHATAFQLHPGRWLRLLDTADVEGGEALFQHQVEVAANAIWLLMLDTGGRVTG